MLKYVRPKKFEMFLHSVGAELAGYIRLCMQKTNIIYITSNKNARQFFNQLTTAHFKLEHEFRC